MAFTCQTSYQACYNNLLSNKAGRLTATGVDTAWYKVNLVQGYNFLTTGIPSSIAKGNLIAVQPNTDIVTFSTSDENDFACGAYNCDKSKCSIDCSKSPMGFRFGIKFHSTNDILINQLNVPGNYSTCGTYQLNAIATYYSNKPNPVTLSATRYINVYPSNETDNETCVYYTQSTLESLNTTTSESIIEITEEAGFTIEPNSLTKEINAFYNSFYSDMAFILTLLSASTGDISGCLSNCSSKGFCNQNPSTYEYECECVGYSTGSDCSSDIRPCSSNPCLNNGLCSDFSKVSSSLNISTTDYLCQCALNYYGNQCQNKINVCKNVTCSANGYCIDLGNSTKCKCKKYFSGDFCEIESNELKTVKAVISMATIIAFIVFIVYITIVLLCDYTSFLHGKFTPKHDKPVNYNSSISDKNRIRKLIYVN